MSLAQSPLGFIATLETSNYSFEAHGLTEAQAGAALSIALAIHADQTGIEADWWQHYGVATIRPFMPGIAMRDGERLGGL